MTSRDWDERYSAPGLVWSSEANRFLVGEVAGLAGGRALDLGCGEGRNAIWLAERGWTVTGVDFSTVALAKARQLAAERGVEVEWVEADLLTYLPPALAFDLVALLYLHLPAAERKAVLRRAAAALRPGGTLLVVGHDRLNLTEGYGGPRDPGVLFTADEVAADLPGLVVERAERVIRQVEVEGRTANAIDALVRARRPVPAG